MSHPLSSVHRMRWGQMERSCPEFAKLIRHRFETEQIFLLGTLRPDGSPRISAVECDFVGDDLFIGTIWQSAKALDLLRDDWVTVHSLVPDKVHESDSQGDIKLYGRAVQVTELGQRRRYEAAIKTRIGCRHVHTRRPPSMNRTIPARSGRVRRSGSG